MHIEAPVLARPFAPRAHCCVHFAVRVPFRRGGGGNALFYEGGSLQIENWAQKLHQRVQPNRAWQTIRARKCVTLWLQLPQTHQGRSQGVQGTRFQCCLVSRSSETPQRGWFGPPEGHFSMHGSSGKLIDGILTFVLPHNGLTLLYPCGCSRQCWDASAMVIQSRHQQNRCWRILKQITPDTHINDDIRK